MVRQSQPRPYSMAKVGTLTAMCEKIYFQYLLSRKIQTNNDKLFKHYKYISITHKKFKSTLPAEYC